MAQYSRLCGGGYCVSVERRGEERESGTFVHKRIVSRYVEGHSRAYSSLNGKLHFEQQYISATDPPIGEQMLIDKLKLHSL